MPSRRHFEGTTFKSLHNKNIQQLYPRKISFPTSKREKKCSTKKSPNLPRYSSKGVVISIHFKKFSLGETTSNHGQQNARWHMEPTKNNEASHEPWTSWWRHMKSHSRSGRFSPVAIGFRRFRHTHRKFRNLKRLAFFTFSKINWAMKKNWLVGLYRGLYYPVI